MNSKLSSDIKAEATRLGFFACGIAKAAPVREEVANIVRQWIETHPDLEPALMNKLKENAYWLLKAVRKRMPTPNS